MSDRAPLAGPHGVGGAGGIHQFVPMLHRHDAVGSHTLAVQGALAARGVTSQIYVELDDPETGALTRPAAAFAADARPGDVLVYQLATASGLAAMLARRPEPLVVNYHNVTPPELIGPWDNALARHQVQARLELAALAPRAVLAVAVSEVNRADLVAGGYGATAVVPPCLELGAAEHRPPHPARRAGARWLAVGRLAPNKALEDALLALLVYRLEHDPEATLTVVGRTTLPAYTEALHRFAADLGVGGAVGFVGRLSDQGLARAYEDSDVLVVTSEHEGFCVPVVEAMGHGLPVVAYREGALPEVGGDAAVLVGDKDPTTLASAVHRLQCDEQWRAERIAAGRRQLARLDLERAGPIMADLLLAVRDKAPLPEAARVQDTRRR